MTDDQTSEGDKTTEGARLWRQARQAWAAGAGAEPEGAETDGPDPALLAAYMDGRLAEDAAVALETRLAGDAELLAQLLALRETLTEAPPAAPAAVVARAQALRAGPAARPLAAALPASGPDVISRWFGGWLRPALPAFAVLALMVACAGAFELGRSQSERILLQQAAGTVDSDLPDPLSLDIPI